MIPSTDPFENYLYLIGIVETMTMRKQIIIDK